MKLLVDLILGAAFLFIVAIIAWRGAEIAGDHFEGIARKIGAVAVGLALLGAARVLAQRAVGSAIAQALVGTTPICWLEALVDIGVMFGYYGVTSVLPVLWWRRHRG